MDASSSQDQDILKQFRFLVSQNVALPVAAMNALVAKIKVNNMFKKKYQALIERAF